MNEPAHDIPQTLPRSSELLIVVGFLLMAKGGLFNLTCTLIQLTNTFHRLAPVSLVLWNCLLQSPISDDVGTGGRDGPDYQIMPCVVFDIHVAGHLEKSLTLR